MAEDHRTSRAEWEAIALEAEIHWRDLLERYPDSRRYVRRMLRLVPVLVDALPDLPAQDPGKLVELIYRLAKAAGSRS